MIEIPIRGYLLVNPLYSERLAKKVKVSTRQEIRHFILVGTRAAVIPVVSLQLIYFNPLFVVRRSERYPTVLPAVR